MNLDLPKVSRTVRAVVTSRSTRFPYLFIAATVPAGTQMPWSWVSFQAAAFELARALRGVDQREIEQLLFEGWPIITDDFIYVPQTVILSLLASAIRRGLIEPPAGWPEEDPPEEPLVHLDDPIWQLWEPQA